MAQDREFTVQQGLAVQQQQLKEWKSLLKREVYIALETYITKMNHKAKDGFDIWRGTDMNNFIGNYLMYKKRGKLAEILVSEGKYA